MNLTKRLTPGRLPTESKRPKRVLWRAEVGHDLHKLRLAASEFLSCCAVRYTAMTPEPFKDVCQPQDCSLSGLFWEQSG